MLVYMYGRCDGWRECGIDGVKDIDKLTGTNEGVREDDWVGVGLEVKISDGRTEGVKLGESVYEKVGTCDENDVVGVGEWDGEHDGVSLGSMVGGDVATLSMTVG